MCDITRSNYESMYNQMIKAIEEASFIAFDAEYTSLSLNHSLCPSLSDTAEVRYEKLRKNVSQSSMCQIGISAYVPNCQKENSYAVQTFNCYLFPQSFGPVDARFVCQASAMEFLCDYDFDFNKFIYDGIPFLNRDQEQLLRLSHMQGRLKKTFYSMKLRMADVSELRDLRNSISNWCLQANQNETMEFSSPTEYTYRYMLLDDLKEKFNNLLCKFVENDKIRITKTNDTVAVQKCFDEELERFFQTRLGFSRIIRAISSLKKPIVGHNCLTDLFFIFEKFHQKLPAKYKDFKKQLHDLFPVIYDTKHLSLLLRNVMRHETTLFQETRLEDLHRMLNSNEGKFYVLYSPHIDHAPGYDRYAYSDHVHEAGYDAFLTGYVFIRMAHFLAAKDVKSTEMRPFSYKEQIKAIKQFENRVNIARAALKYLNFGGEDPPAITPVKFTVTLRPNVNDILSANELAHEFLPFGSTDVELETPNKAIVTVSNRKRETDVICAFKRHRKYRVASYNTKFSIKTENVLTIGCGIVLVLTSGSIVYLLLDSSQS